jgi:hypothetical protein
VSSTQSQGQSPSYANLHHTQGFVDANIAGHHDGEDTMYAHEEGQHHQID